MQTENERALRSAVERWNAGDLDGYLELYDERIRLHGYSPEPMDKEQTTAFYRSVVAAFPAPTLELHQVFGSGEYVCTVYTMTGKHEGEFMGVPATGREIALPGITALRFANGKCVERWSQADLLGLLVQLGAVPAPA
jgi:predicted ester cyclase